MRTPDRQVDLIERLIRALCVCPEQLDIKTYSDGTALFWSITCNPADGKRIVGGGGAHIAALKLLATAVLRGAGYKLLVEFNRVEPSGYPEVPFLRMPAEQDWDDTDTLALFTELVEACFPSSRPEFMSEERDSESWTMRAWVGEDEHPTLVVKVSRSLHALFIPVGMNAGRKVYANLTREDRALHGQDHGQRGAARPAHVHGSVAEQRFAAVPREPRGELGARDVHLRRLGNAKAARAAEDGGEL